MNRVDVIPMLEAALAHHFPGCQFEVKMTVHGILNVKVFRRALLKREDVSPALGRLGKTRLPAGGRKIYGVNVDVDGGRNTVGEDISLAWLTSPPSEFDAAMSIWAVLHAENVRKIGQIGDIPVYFGESPRPPASSYGGAIFSERGIIIAPQRGGAAVGAIGDLGLLARGGDLRLWTNRGGLVAFSSEAAEFVVVPQMRTLEIGEIGIRIRTGGISSRSGFPTYINVVRLEDLAALGFRRVGVGGIFEVAGEGESVEVGISRDEDLAMATSRGSDGSLHIVAWNLRVAEPASSDGGLKVISPPMDAAGRRAIPSGSTFTPIGQAFPVWAELAEELGADDPAIVASSEFFSGSDVVARSVFVGDLEGNVLSLSERTSFFRLKRTEEQRQGATCMFTVSSAMPLAERLASAGAEPRSTFSAGRIPPAKVGLPPSHPFYVAVRGWRPVTGVAWVSEFGDLTVAAGSTAAGAFLSASGDVGSALEAVWAGAPDDADDILVSLLTSSQPLAEQSPALT